MTGLQSLFDLWKPLHILYQIKPHHIHSVTKCVFLFGKFSRKCIALMDNNQIHFYFSCLCYMNLAFVHVSICSLILYCRIHLMWSPLIHFSDELTHDVRYIVVLIVVVKFPFYKVAHCLLFIHRVSLCGVESKMFPHKTSQSDYPFRSVISSSDCMTFAFGICRSLEESRLLCSASCVTGCRWTPKQNISTHKLYTQKGVFFFKCCSVYSPNALCQLWLTC